jgi:hypothetical protein
MHVETDTVRRSREDRLARQIQNIASTLQITFNEALWRVLLVRIALDDRREKRSGRRRH